MSLLDELSRAAWRGAANCQHERTQPKTALDTERGAHGLPSLNNLVRRRLRFRNVGETRS
jgi:hypothetical protein